MLLSGVRRPGWCGEADGPRAGAVNVTDLGTR